MPRKGENIYKRKDGRWEGRYIKEYDVSKKAKYGYVYAHSYADLKKILTKCKADVDTRKAKNALHEKNVSNYAKLWLNEIRLQTKHSTYVKYYNISVNHIIPLLGKYFISEVTTDILKSFVKEKLTCGNIRTHQGLSPKTVKDILSVIKLIFRYAEANGEIYCCNFDMIKVKAMPNNAAAISKSEQICLTKYLMNNISYVNLGILICLYTGIRIGEICALQFGDISIPDKIIKVKRTMQRIQNLSDEQDRKTSVMITSPKSEASTAYLDYVLLTKTGEIPTPAEASELTTVKAPWSSGDGTYAEAFKFTVTPNDEVVTGVKVSANGQDKAYNVGEAIQGGISAVFGIIATSASEANLPAADAFTVTLTVE